MGNMMGKVFATFTWPIRTFNIANRAEKVISREKPVPAPSYASTEKQKELMDQVNPHFLKNHYQKNTQLDQQLKDVFVTSTDPQEIKESTKESKSLPQNRHNWENNFMLESYESTKIPVGKCSLKQALNFILQHKKDPITYSSETIASEYKLDKKVVDDILKYFKVYVMYTSSDAPKVEDTFQDMINEAIEARKKAKDKKTKDKIK